MKGKYAWKFFNQPGGVLEVTKEELPENPEANGFVFSCGKWWKTNPKAENLKNLPSGYYEQTMLGKNLDWVRCYAQGVYTYVQEGKPILPEYDDAIMTEDFIEPDPNVPIQIGLDFGLTPAAVFGQKLNNGRWVILDELVTFDMGLERFGHMLKSELEAKYPKYEVMIFGDPAGQQRDQIYEVTAFDHLKTLGMNARPTASNDFKVRREAGAMPMNRLIDGKPGLLVAAKCERTRKALSGGYHFRRGQIAGHERYKDQPFKNQHSHVGDAYMYLMLGGGEHRQLTRGSTQRHRQATAKTDFDIFA